MSPGNKENKERSLLTRLQSLLLNYSRRNLDQEVVKTFERHITQSQQELGGALRVNVCSSLSLKLFLHTTMDTCVCVFVCV